MHWSMRLKTKLINLIKVSNDTTHPTCPQCLDSLSALCVRKYRQSPLCCNAQADLSHNAWVHQLVEVGWHRYVANREFGFY